MQSGYFVIADLSGYTNYVTNVELNHAQAILTHLLELIRDCFQPRLQVRKFEGDAVFAYAPEMPMPWKEGLRAHRGHIHTIFRGAVDSN